MLCKQGPHFYKFYQMKFSQPTLRKKDLLSVLYLLPKKFPGPVPHLSDLICMGDARLRTHCLESIKTADVQRLLSLTFVFPNEISSPPPGTYKTEPNQKFDIPQK